MMDEVVQYIDILEENFVPDVFTQLYINIPIAILDYKQLVADNQPDIKDNKRLTEAELLTAFKYE